MPACMLASRDRKMPTFCFRSCRCHTASTHGRHSDKVSCRRNVSTRAAKMSTL
ncbi:hypothetical protein TSAR_005393 [Trichomalopsis sarcophagae]|uniref:Uncharacterized protein n=1 Tax=Trichomalopsis sarcophagae TaxID=543379 RepID=A0A232ES47_9HYME|nr:hypothetical protein TSAR_005393 [Trichomalopsis sarcophagae]